MLSVHVVQVEALQKQQARLEEQVKHKENDLASALEKVQAFKDTLVSVEQTMDELVEFVNDQPPVLGDVEAIRDQQEQFKVSLEVKLC